MRNTPSNQEPSNTITLEYGTPSEISKALADLGAELSVQAQAVSFLVKIPGAVVRKVPAGYMIGNSVIPSNHGAKDAVGSVQNRFVRVMAANDGKSQLAA